jgi:anti-sigma regulatory factor (Ser/Thr protein kinase)
MADRVDEYIEAVNELVTNALTHGTGKVALKLWVRNDQVVCTITDQGAGFDDPLAGFLPVPIDTDPEHGAGLWLARNFSDSLDFTHSTSGFTARVSSWSHRDPQYAPR